MHLLLLSSSGWLVSPLCIGYNNPWVGAFYPIPLLDIQVISLECCVCDMIWFQEPIDSHHFWELPCLPQAFLLPFPLGWVDALCTMHWCHAPHAGSVASRGVAPPLCRYQHLAARREDVFGANNERLGRSVDDVSLSWCTLAWRWWACGGCTFMGLICGQQIYLAGPLCSLRFTL